MKRLLLLWLFVGACYAQNLQVTGQVQQYIVSTLPTASANNGTVLWVKDANSTTVGATVAGGGSNFLPVKSNGANWLIIAAGAASGGGASSPPYSQSFTSQTTVTLSHNLNTFSVVTACYDNASPAHQITPGAVTLTDGNTVTVTFVSAQSGSCVVNGGVGPQGATGPPASTSIRTVSANDTATTSDLTILVDASSAGVTETLPGTPITGQIVNVKKIDSSTNTVSVDGNGKTIDGSGTLTITQQYVSIQMQYSGSAWFIL